MEVDFHTGSFDHHVIGEELNCFLSLRAQKMINDELKEGARTKMDANLQQRAEFCDLVGHVDLGDVVNDERNLVLDGSVRQADTQTIRIQESFRSG